MVMNRTKKKEAKAKIKSNRIAALAVVLIGIFVAGTTTAATVIIELIHQQMLLLGQELLART
jgi:hypothetical protein